MLHRVEVSPQPGRDDPRGRAVLHQLQALGVSGVERVQVRDVYFLDGELDQEGAAEVAAELLVDPIIEAARFGAPEPAGDGQIAVEVAPLPGVTDAVAESLMKALALIGRADVARASTATRYLLEGDLDRDAAARLASGLLANEVVQIWSLDDALPPSFAPASPTDRSVEVIPVRALDDDGLDALTKERRLSMNLEEMQVIRRHYQGLERDPTDVELEMLAQTWSEHCVHKTFRAAIDYSEYDEDGQEVSRRTIDSMLKTFLRAATEAAAKPWVRSAFVDNAGIVALDDRFDLAFKVETHNHPSALEPFGGANTGVGGVIRDVLGVSARPIANTDVLCFGPQDTPFDAVPDGVLHPRRIREGVVAGIEDYGNKMGIPTVNGAIVYDPGYTANPLVYCGCLGVLPTGSHPTGARPGDLVVALGGRTGRDGIRGATFSSMEMDHTTEQIAGSSVQIGNPIEEKQVLEAVLRARDERLYSAITDCGAGGFSSAVGEMAEGVGADVELDNAPLKYPGLQPWEIWLSEAQERMVMAVPPENRERLMQIGREVGVEITALGTFTGDGVVTIRSGGTIVGQLDAAFLHDGLPQRRMRAEWRPPLVSEPTFEAPADLSADLLALLGAPDTCSRADVVHVYDHEVQGGTIAKPIVGQGGHGDAAVVAPLDALRAGGRSAASLSVGINIRYGKIDPWRMAWAAVDEAVRNGVAVGADPDRMSLLDNFCWGNPNLPDRLGGLVRCGQGCHDAAVAYGMPYVSGKDSLNNEYTGADGEKHAIPGTILISALGVVPDLDFTATSDLKSAGDLIYVVGETRDELGGSAWYGLRGELGANAPAPVDGALDLHRAVHRAIAGGLVAAAHDCSEGGLAVAIAEMCIGGGLGATVDLAAAPTVRGPGALTDPARIAFSESLSRYVIAVRPEDAAAFEAALAGHPFACVGAAMPGDVLAIHFGAERVAEADLAALRRAFAG